MSEALSEQKKLVWYWNKKAIPLNKLEDNQLYSVQTSIIRNKSKAWFGVRSKIWLDAITELAKKREKQNTAQIISEITDRRIKKVERVADAITSGIVKSFEKNNYN